MTDTNKIVVHQQQGKKKKKKKKEKKKTVHNNYVNIWDVLMVTSHNMLIHMVF